jgi:hypothetical protein
MEDCLLDVMNLEGWDPVTMTMPDDLRAMLEREIDGV